MFFAIVDMEASAGSIDFEAAAKPSISSTAASPAYEFDEELALCLGVWWRFVNGQMGSRLTTAVSKTRSRSQIAASTLPMPHRRQFKPHPSVYAACAGSGSGPRPAAEIVSRAEMPLAWPWSGGSLASAPLASRWRPRVSDSRARGLRGGDEPRER